ncbi:MAG: ubiquitin-activating E1 FCCH domain-containing protein [Pirellulales bacterium]
MRFEVLEDRSLLSITLTGVPNWFEQGPRPIIEAQLNALPNDPAAGAIQSIAVNPNIVDPDHPNNHQIYVGAVNGGVWRTDNFDPANPTATAWRPLTDQQASLAISSVAIDPLDTSGNVVFAGTGSFSNLAQQGDPPVGLLRTTDGGVSWTTHKLVAFALRQPKIKTVLPTSVDTDPGPGVKEVILVGAIDFGDDGGGLYRSTDNGDNFAFISGTNGLPAGDVSHIVVEHNRRPRFFAAVPGHGIFRSDFIGQTWTSASSGITGLASSSNIQMAAFKNVFATVLYAAIVDTSNRLTGVFRSTTHGDSWTRLALPTDFSPFVLGQSGFQIIADATNGQAYLGGGGGDDREIWRYDPAGAGSWVLIVGEGAKNNTSPHADSRDFAFVGTSLLNANDGGLYFINNPRDAMHNSWQSLQGSGTTGIGAMEMHNISYDNRFNVLWGGSQDNGTSGQSAPNNLVWKLYAGGDGGDVAVDSVTLAPAGNTIRYVSSQGLINFSAHVFDTATNDASHVDLLPAAGLEGLAPSFITPIELNALAPPSGQSKRLVVGGRAVLADTIKAVAATSPIKIETKDDFGHGLSTGDTVTISGVIGIPAANGTFTVTFLNKTKFSLNGTTGVGTYTANTGLWVKNSSVLPGGAVYESRNAGIAPNTAAVVWTRVPTGPGFGSVIAMAAGASSGILGFPNVLYVGSGNRVFLRSTAGGTLSQTPAPFPGSTVTDVVMDPNNWRRAFVSDSQRVFETTNAGASWFNITSNLNESDIHSLEFVPVGGRRGGVLLAGGLNGVSRLILSSPSIWTEYGARLPNAKVYDMKYDATDDKLVASTLGRGAWTISNVSTTVGTPGVLRINGDMDFAGQPDDIKLQLDPNNSTLVDVFLNTLTPLATFQLSTIQQILVNALRGDDNLTVDFNNGNPIPLDGLVYNGGTGADQVSVVGDANYTLTNSSLTRSAGGTIDLVNVQIASLTGGAGANRFTVESWNGSLVSLAGLAGNDSYIIGSGDLDPIDAAVAVTDTSGAGDNATLNDAGHAKLVDYTIDGTGVTTEFTSGAARAFLGLAYNAGALELVTLNGSAGANTFYATPHVDTTFAINGNNPTFAGPGADYLKVEFAGTRGRKLTYSGPPLGNGMWEFLGSGVPLEGARKNIDFTSIEKLNGDGILEVVTTPAGLRAPDVRIFDILSGTQIDQFQGSIPGFIPGLQVAVGDVSGDGRADIATGWDTGLPYAVWHNDTNSISTFTPYTGVGWHAPVRVAIKRTGPLGAAEIFTAQGPGGRSHEIRRFSPTGTLVDFILEDDPEFANGIWLG